MSRIADEQTKLLAGLLNTVASAVLIAGVVAPLVTISYELTNAPALPLWRLALLSVLWLAVGSLIHYVAHRVLRRLTP